MTRWRDLRARGQKQLKSADAGREISIFVREITGQTVVVWDEHPSIEEIQAFENFLLERARGRPLSKVLEFRDFWKDRFFVTDDVLDPRPDSELLVEIGASYSFANNVLELGVGSGAVLLSLLKEMPEAVGLGTDISPKALEIAKQNAVRLGLEDRVTWLESDWFSEVEGKFDLIICNPPYLSMGEYGERERALDWDPRIALTDNADGLTAFRDIASKAARFLTDNGVVLLEIGWTQAEAVKSIFISQGFDNIQVFRDINEKDRVMKIHRIKA
ncbi:MAG: peptide chain release factor N(5)-glutamine methyltransferase [Pseudomonadota bacterium]